MSIHCLFNVHSMSIQFTYILYSMYLLSILRLMILTPLLQLHEVIHPCLTPPLSYTKSRDAIAS